MSFTRLVITLIFYIDQPGPVRILVAEKDCMQSEHEQIIRAWSKAREHTSGHHTEISSGNCQSSHPRRYCSHPFWRVAEVEQLCPPQPFALLFPISGAAASPGHHNDFLDVRRVDKELHLDARALHHVPEDERRVRPAASHRDENTGECGRRVREVDREYGTGTNALRVGS